ncbi:probable G-protein coupled receptor B0563.6 isoform X3 [Cephus cinctus]|uniref:Probable G-protein coupled receptor B0563.6 isoform X3 n=1 Tax=Cephus cinctus TaxID=211228 RepID=A0AAJ7RJN3_CEPCN|nr:probable G-protein coupled receptor B0563.6 isoform X3 [Cephus cinctus]XP_024942135.1 probable G-protein coupled receptor B0563.6 isoform X3 [Cephus cinctus]
MMLLALTMERYVSICYPGQHTRPLCGSPTLMLVLIPLTTFLIYLPSIFRGEITTCLLTSAGPFIYQKRDNIFFMHSLFYQVYKVVLEIVFKVAPTILLAGFNLRVMIAYRRSCERRRSTTLSRTASNDEAHRTFAEERRLLLLLGSTSILFLVCVSPMVILNVTVSESNLSLYPYQVDSPSFPLLLTVIRYRGSQPSFLVCLFFAQILSPATDIISPQVFRALANLLERTKTVGTFSSSARGYRYRGSRTRRLPSNNVTGATRIIAKRKATVSDLVYVMASRRYRPTDARFLFIPLDKPTRGFGPLYDSLT